MVKSTVAFSALLVFSELIKKEHSIMSDQFAQLRTAVEQAAPVLLDRKATVEKTGQLAAEATAQGANLVLFPEALIPCRESGLTYTRKNRLAGYTKFGTTL